MFIRSESGSVVVEYTLLVAFLCLLLAITISSTGLAISDKFTTAAEVFNCGDIPCEQEFGIPKAPEDPKKPK